MKRVTYNNINHEYAQKVYNILIDIGGATDSSLEEFRFVHYVVSDSHPYVEYCYHGSVDGYGLPGRGGKFCITPENWHMSCYTEDWNVYRQMVIDTINLLLKDLRDEYLKELQSEH